MILLLAGTSEARRLAERLAASRLPVLASLAGATREPLALPVPTRIGGFGGEAGFRAALDRHGVRAVIDATHPFAARITARTHSVCEDLELPLLRVERLGWACEGGWPVAADPAKAILMIPEDAVVFLATGRQSLHEWAGLKAARVHLRVIDEPDRPFPFPGSYVVARPPFGRAEEAATFASLGVTHLVAKDAGGQEGRAKLDAARDLGITVILLRRPPRPEGLAVVEGVDEALRWLALLPGTARADEGGEEIELTP